MRPFALQLSRTVKTASTISQARARPASITSPRPLSATWRLTPQQQSRMASTGELNVEATPKSAPGVELSSQQKTLVGCVLDLFAGRPSLAKLGLWKDDAVFEDPLAIAKGRKEYEAQWYGLQTAFSELERQHQEVTSAGNPIEMDLKMRYVVKGINKEQVINSKVLIHTDGDQISKVEDKWNGSLPTGTIANAFRRLNASTMPHVVGVPKTAEEDAKKGNQ